MRELEPLLAADGIDINNPPDRDTFNRALQRATAQRNLELFSPAGKRRKHATNLLRLITSAMCAGDSELAEEYLEVAIPESPGDTEPEVSACMGAALGLLDTWLSDPSSGFPAEATHRVRLPAGEWFGKRAALSELALARKGRSFDSVGALIVKQGSHQTLAGSVLALSAAIQLWSDVTGTPTKKLISDEIR